MCCLIPLEFLGKQRRHTLSVIETSKNWQPSDFYDRWEHSEPSSFLTPQVSCPWRGVHLGGGESTE